MATEIAATPKSPPSKKMSSTRVRKSERAMAPYHVKEAEVQELCTYTNKILERPRKGGKRIELFTQQWLPKEGEPKALVFYVHGLHDHAGRFARGTSQAVSGVQSFVDAGFGVFGIDHEGHGRSAGLHGMFSDVTTLAYDLIAYVQSVKEEDQFRDKNVFLMGGSMGGLIMLKAAILLKEADTVDLVSGIVANSCLLYVHGQSKPPAAAQKLARVVKKFAPHIPLVAGNKGKNCNPKMFDEMEDDQKGDPLFYSGNLRIATGLALKDCIAQVKPKLEQIATPLLLQHGTGDRVCDVRGSEEIIARVQSADKQLKTYDGGAHNLEHEVTEFVDQVRNDRLSWLSERS